MRLRLPPGLALAVAFAFGAGPASARTLDQLVDPRPTTRVLDVMDVLTAEDKAAIDGLRVDRGEIVVVVSDTVHGLQPRDYATSLFNTWGIGTQRDNTGVLLFIALDDRKAEIVFGDGLKRSARARCPSWAARSRPSPTPSTRPARTRSPSGSLRSSRSASSRAP